MHRDRQGFSNESVGWGSTYSKSMIWSENWWQPCVMQAARSLALVANKRCKPSRYQGRRQDPTTQRQPKVTFWTAQTQSVTSRSRDLHLALLRLQLELCVQFGAAEYKKGIDTLSWVQWPASNIQLDTGKSFSSFRRLSIRTGCPEGLENLHA